MMLSTTPCHAAEGDPGSSEATPKVRTFASFKAFFKKKGAITESEVTDQFGPADSHAALYEGQPEPPSWWYYEIDNGERIGIAIEEHRVVLVTRHHKNKSIDILRERASLTK